MGPSNKNIHLFPKTYRPWYCLFKTVLEVNKIWAKYKMSGMLLFCRRKIFENTSILITNAEWMNMIALKYIFKPQSKWWKMSNSKIIQRIKTLPHIFPRSTIFVPKFSRLPVDSISEHPKLSKCIVKYSYGYGARDAYLAHRPNLFEIINHEFLLFKIDTWTIEALCWID